MVCDFDGSIGSWDVNCVRNKGTSFASCAFACEGSWLVVKLECAFEVFENDIFYCKVLWVVGTQLDRKGSVPSPQRTTVELWESCLYMTSQMISHLRISRTGSGILKSMHHLMLKKWCWEINATWKIEG
ncbi:uncharacterized protein [Acropora muricata]|uniref:uncharacterized protein isoform X2 n=1 Tax=Acropora muricata TaxID=159855 RepID=UPI0034E46E39